jgi:hypothetical protein
VVQAYEVVRKNKRAKIKREQERKGVKPDGHGEATHGHELYLHELASISSMMVIP